MRLTMRRISKRPLFGFQGTRAELPLHYLTVSKNENDPIYAQNDNTSKKVMKGDRFCVGMVFVQLPLSHPNSLEQLELPIFRRFTGITPRKGKSEENRKRSQNIL